MKSKQQELLVFFTLAYLISWAIWLPLYGHIFGLSNLPTLPFHHGIGGLGPLIASFLTTWIFLKEEGIKALLAKCFQIKPLIYLTVALFSPFGQIYLPTGTDLEKSGSSLMQLERYFLS